MRSDRGGCRASAAVSALRAWDVAVQFRAAGATGGTHANKPTSPNLAICYRLSETENVAATAVGLRDEELHVEDVAVRILPQPAEPHGAAATFDLVRVRGGEEVARES